MYFQSTSCIQGVSKMECSIGIQKICYIFPKCINSFFGELAWPLLVLFLCLEKQKIWIKENFGEGAKSHPKHMIAATFLFTSMKSLNLEESHTLNIW